ncbi:MAG: DUF4139 domain-containing protein [Pseudomonadota bacterium]
MRHPLGTAALLAVALISLPALAAAQDLDLKRVVLSTGGLGYFEYEAQVTGDAELAITVPLAQVDDVLKSLVVYDQAGRIGAVSLPGRQPLAQVFEALPFDQAALTSPAALLRALAGAEITASGPQGASGRILSVVEEQVIDEQGRASSHTRVTLMGARGLASFVLEEAESLRFTDPQVEAQVSEALEALARHGERDRRTLTLSAPGEGPRLLRVAYVVEVPLWKTSYRLSLAEDEPMAAMQGWAVLENQSGENWEGVELTLVSGNPVAFRQALYESYYLDRPEIPVSVVSRILAPLAPLGLAARAGDSAPRAALQAEAAPAPAPAYAEILEAGSREGVAQTLFRLPDPVDLAKGESLLVPFLDRGLPGEQLSYYRPGVSGVHPLSSLDLRNNTETSLPPGLITLYQRAGDDSTSYLGDARLDLLAPASSRLISFALDAKVTVAEREERAQAVTQVTIADGIMTVTQEDRITYRYQVTGASDAARTLLIETPRLPGWSLSSATPEANESLEGYRQKLTLAAGESQTVTLTLSRPISQEVVLADQNDARLGFYLDSDQFPEAVKEKLRDLADLRTALAEARRALSAAQDQRAALVSDQGRLRENLAAVPEGSDLSRRYLALLSEQEDRLESLDSLVQTRQSVEQQAAAALRRYLAELRL